MAEVVRGRLVESVHRGMVIGLDAVGSVVLELGNVRLPIAPRSCLKPLQAVAMLRSGWSPSDDRHVAIAAASHSGEQVHLAAVLEVLGAAGLTPDSLQNTPALPLDPAAARAAIREGGSETSLFQNCSGKHAAMLASCVAAGWPTGSYREPSHPLQEHIAAVIAELTGEPIGPPVVDGCGAPAFLVSLLGVARAYQRLATASPASPEGRVASAMRRHPLLVAGTSRDVTAAMVAVDGLVVKDGAEGVMAAAHRSGVVAAVKISDGAARARMPVLAAALKVAGLPALGEAGAVMGPPPSHRESRVRSTVEPRGHGLR